MIYFTTFIFTLLLVHIARAVPECGAASPEDVYNPAYDNEQLTLADCKVPWDLKYDNPNGDTKTLACSDFAPQYPHFGDFPTFPYIGAAFDIQGQNPSECGKCWNLTNTESHKFIYLTAIDSGPSGSESVLSKHAYDALNYGNCKLESEEVPRHFCGLK